MISPGVKLVLACALALCAAQLSACKGCSKRAGASQGNRPFLADVVVKPIPATEVGGQSVQLDAEVLRSATRTQLEGADIFGKLDGRTVSSMPSATVGMEFAPYSEGTLDAPEIAVKLHLTVTLRPESQAFARFHEDVSAVGQAPLESRGTDKVRAAFQRLAERVAEDLLRSYVAKQRLWIADSREVGLALESNDTELRVEAMRAVGERKLREHISRILKLLSDQDESVRDAALGAVVALRERGAIKALADSHQMRDVREMRKVLDAIAALGGGEARDYLGFVAETHDDEDIRIIAKEALERLDRREKAAQPTK